MRTASQRIAKYEARMLSTLVDPVLSAVNMQQITNFTSYIQDFYPNQLQLRVILNASGNHPDKFAAFEAFHGELYHLSKVAQGPALLAAAAVLGGKWATILGPAQVATLKQIALDIYAITLP